MLTGIDFAHQNFTIEEEECIKDEESTDQDYIVLDEDTFIACSFSDPIQSGLLFQVYNTEYFYPHHEIPCSSIVYDCKVIDQSNLAIASSNKDIEIFDMKQIFSYTPISKLIGHDDEVNCLEFKNNLISGSKDKTVIVWDNNSIKERIFLEEEVFKIFDEKNLIVCGEKNILVLDNHKIVNKIVCKYEIQDVIFKDNFLYICDDKGILSCYDFRNTKIKWEEITDSSINTIDFHNDNFVLGTDEGIKVLDSNKNLLVHKCKNISIYKLRVKDGKCFYGEESNELFYLVL